MKTYHTIWIPGTLADVRTFLNEDLPKTFDNADVVACDCQKEGVLVLFSVPSPLASL